MKLLGLGGFQSEASTVPIRDKAIQTVVKENRAVPEVAVRECVNLDGIAAQRSGLPNEASAVLIRDGVIRAVPGEAVRECVNLDGMAAEHVAFVRLTVAELRAV